MGGSKGLGGASFGGEAGGGRREQFERRDSREGGGHLLPAILSPSAGQAVGHKQGTEESTHEEDGTG